MVRLLVKYMEMPEPYHGFEKSARLIVCTALDASSPGLWLYGEKIVPFFNWSVTTAELFRVRVFNCLDGTCLLK